MAFPIVGFLGNLVATGLDPAYQVQGGTGEADITTMDDVAVMHAALEDFSDPAMLLVSGGMLITGAAMMATSINDHRGMDENPYLP